MAASVTYTLVPATWRADAGVMTCPVYRVQIAWESDDAADPAPGTVPAGTAVSAFTISGFLCKVTWVPDGVATPTNLYDTTIADVLGADILATCPGSNCLAAGAHFRQPRALNAAGADYVGYAPVLLYNTTLNLEVLNAGNAKKGSIYLDIVPSSTR